MKVTNETASELTKGQEVTSTYISYISNEGIVSERKTVDTLKVTTIRKSKKSECGLRVKFQIIEGASEGSMFTITNFDRPKVNIGTITKVII